MTRILGTPQWHLCTACAGMGFHAVHEPGSTPVLTEVCQNCHGAGGYWFPPRSPEDITATTGTIAVRPSAGDGERKENR